MQKLIYIGNDQGIRLIERLAKFQVKKGRVKVERFEVDEDNNESISAETIEALLSEKDEIAILEKDYQELVAKAEGFEPEGQILISEEDLEALKANPGSIEEGMILVKAEEFEQLEISLEESKLEEGSVVFDKDQYKALNERIEGLENAEIIQEGMIAVKEEDYDELKSNLAGTEELNEAIVKESEDLTTQIEAMKKVDEKSQEQIKKLKEEVKNKDAKLKLANK